ncbi:hypothetical protein Zm00014a_011753 [Zea mays]|uniref:Uncharacterized protein n=1 Tax=Zea mays TaxID=4577 RepID=A0A3L6DJW5_MAIZE|nr:hypothetical protein Zm00014a_011753 [Zea mays]
MATRAWALLLGRIIARYGPRKVHSNCLHPTAHNCDL